MSQTPRPWIVTPHTPIEKLEDNLWALSSKVPGKPFPRRMVMVKLSDQRIVFIDAVPMEDAALAEIRAWGKPAILVVTNGYHRLDVHAFREKLGLTVCTPLGSAERVRKAVHVDGTLETLPRDPALRFEYLAGVKGGEAVFITTAPSGKVTMIFSDGIMNIQERLPFPMRLLGWQGGPKTVPIFRLLFAKDKPALRAQYEKLALTPDLGRLLFCHGATIERDVPGALNQAAATL